MDGIPTLTSTEQETTRITSGSPVNRTRSADTNDVTGAIRFLLMRCETLLDWIIWISRSLGVASLPRKEAAIMEAMDAFVNVSCKAVLFDMDGTLVDSTRVVELAWGWWAARHHLTLQTVPPASAALSVAPWCGPPIRFKLPYVRFRPNRMNRFA